MRCFLFMLSFTATDRSTICVLEENMVPALADFINIDPSDRWAVEDMIGKHARKETITKDDVTLGYLLLSIPEKTVEVSFAGNASADLVASLKQIAESNSFKFAS